jgi:hypothetical protein
MAYNVSQAFREQCYKGSSLYKCRLIIGEVTIPTSQIASIIISSPIVDSESQIFYIGTFISQKLTIQFKNLDGIDTASGTEVELYISQYVNNDWEEVPIGKYLIDEAPEDYYKASKIVCLDYAIKFNTNLDYSPAFVDDKITIDNLLQWICTHYGVTLGSYPNTNGSVEIGTYDSTVSGKRWISYIAELKGCNAKMDRQGQLTLVPLKSSPVVTIDAKKSALWELGEQYDLKTVTYFDATRNFTYGDKLYVNYNDDPLYYNSNRIVYRPSADSNTLIIRQDNPFIVNSTVVENIYNVVKNYKVWSLKTDNYGDVSLDAWDNITYTLGNETYNTLNNNTITYEMTVMSKVDTKIPTKQQEVTTNVVEGTPEQKIRKIGSEVNSLSGQVTIFGEELSETEESLAEFTLTTDASIQSLTQTTSNISSTEQTHYQEMLSKMDDKASISDIETITNQVNVLQTDTYTKTEINKILNGTDENGNVVSFLQTLSATLDENGMSYDKSGANTSSNINQAGVTVTNKKNNSELLFAGYDEQKLEALVRVANLYLTRFLGLDVWRIEIINDTTNGKGLGFFYIG